MIIRYLVLALSFAVTAITVCATDYVAMVAAIAGMPVHDRAEAIARFVLETGKDEDTAASATQVLENTLLSASSPLRDDDLYIAFAEEMLRSGYPNRVRNEWMLAAVKQNRPGSMLPEFEYDTRNGVRHSSAELRGCISVLMFYDPDCGDCGEEIARIQSDPHMTEAIDTGKLRMVCIYADGDRDLWLSAADKIPATWTDGFDTGRIVDEELFVLPMIPTIYVVDAEGKILRKEALVEDVLNLEF